jgi:hypothetical protein
VIDPRTAIGTALDARKTEGAAAFRRILGAAHPETGLPCWGDLADHFDALLTTDEARIDVFEGLRSAGELAALVLFLALNRTHPGVLEHVWQVAPELPATIQCALVSLYEWANVSRELAATLHPAARVLLADPDARDRDREFYAAQAGALRAQRTRLSQVSESAGALRTS